MSTPFPPCPACDSTEGYDVEVYVQFTCDDDGDWDVGLGGTGIRCQSCGEDSTEAGQVEPRNMVLAAIWANTEHRGTRDLRDLVGNVLANYEKEAS